MSSLTILPSGPGCALDVSTETDRLRFSSSARTPSTSHGEIPNEMWSITARRPGRSGDPAPLFSSPWFEYRCDWGCCDLFTESASTLRLRVTVAATSLRGGGRPERSRQGRTDCRHSKRLQQCATRDLPAVVVKQFGRHVVHRADF